jgi:hypothetical protein
VLKKSGQKFLSQEKQKEVSKFDVNLQGSELEHKIYNRFRSAMEHLNLKNTVFINGFLKKKNRSTIEFELDFLIISAEQKMIIQIEAKSSCSHDQHEKAAEQLDNGFNYFKKEFPFSKQDGWKYARVMHFEKLQQDVCQDCQHYVLGLETDITLWCKTFLSSVFPSKHSFHLLYKSRCLTKNEPLPQQQGISYF